MRSVIGISGWTRLQRTASTRRSRLAGNCVFVSVLAAASAHPQNVASWIAPLPASRIAFGKTAPIGRGSLTPCYRPVGRRDCRQFGSSSSNNDKDKDLHEIVDMIKDFQRQKKGGHGKKPKNEDKVTKKNDRQERLQQVEPDEFDPPDSEVEKRTMDWLKRVVIGLSLCPFADKPLREGNLNVFVVRGDDPENILGAVLYQSLLRKDEPGTTLVVAPECFPDDFESYLEIVATFEEDIMEENHLPGTIQVAPFHPNFEFQGAGDGVENYTNRSPYPMFHILREDEVGWAVDKLGGDAEKVWKRNIGLLEDIEESLGSNSIPAFVSGKPIKGELGKILQRHRLKLSDDPES